MPLIEISPHRGEYRRSPGGGLRSAAARAAAPIPPGVYPRAGLRSDPAGRTSPRGGRSSIALAAIALLALAGCGDRGKAASDKRETPSGLPVPRYVALKFGEVNARGGPGDDYRLLWVYRARGLPVQVVAETKEWRRVCDPTGGLAWVKSTGVDGRRTVARLTREPLPLLEKPQSGAKVSAVMAGQATARLDKCKDGWCRIKSTGGSGWAPAGEVWGTDEKAQCH